VVTTTAGNPGKRLLVALPENNVTCCDFFFASPLKPSRQGAPLIDFSLLSHEHQSCTSQATSLGGPGPYWNLLRDHWSRQPATKEPQRPKKRATQRSAWQMSCLHAARGQRKGKQLLSRRPGAVLEMTPFWTEEKTGFVGSRIGVGRLRSPLVSSSES
jgi:hypothetical protein